MPRHLTRAPAVAALRGRRRGGLHRHHLLRLLVDGPAAGHRAQSRRRGCSCGGPFRPPPGPDGRFRDGVA